MNKKLLFFGIILGNIYFFSNLLALGSLSESYITGRNSIEKVIDFTLEVEDSLYIGKGTELDFGMIPKGSNGTVIAKSNIEIIGGTEGTIVKLVYGGVIEASDGYQKIKISYTEKSEERIKERINKKNDEEEIKEIDVYLKNFEENYTLKKDLDGSMTTFIPIIGEIRGVGESKIGKYTATIPVEIITIQSNVGGRE